MTCLKSSSPLSLSTLKELIKIGVSIVPVITLFTGVLQSHYMHHTIKVLANKMLHKQLSHAPTLEYDDRVPAMGSLMQCCGYQWMALLYSLMNTLWYFMCIIRFRYTQSNWILQILKCVNSIAFKHSSLVEIVALTIVSVASECKHFCTYQRCLMLS